jgi:hypothetical protein
MPDLDLDPLAGRLGYHRLEQGTGTLGQRMDRLWEARGGGPIVFLGSDSPDAPAEALASVSTRLARHEVLLGPVDDGGYWTLAARRHAPTLLADIDWGTDRVYHQSLAAAEAAGLRAAPLAPWHDVDSPEDLERLRHRLARATEPSLIRLRHRLDRVLQEASP